MLKNSKELYGHKIAATDGEIGHLKDFYFDDISWAIRYLVVDTGSWLSGREVLLAPHSFGHWDQQAKTLGVNIGKKKIEHSPSIDAHRPVSRQNEEEYCRYYGWPGYWDAGGVWGAAGYPLVTPPTGPDNLHHHGHNQRDDVHLRSTKAVSGYRIEARDGTLGSVSGFIIDTKTWTIRDLAVEAGHWYAGKEILIAPAKVERISYDESKVFVKLSKADIDRTKEHEVVTAA